MAEEHKFKMMRKFAVTQWEFYDMRVENLRSEIRSLEKRKRRLWDFIAKLDKMNKEKGSDV